MATRYRVTVPLVEIEGGLRSLPMPADPQIRWAFIRVERPLACFHARRLASTDRPLET
jgi:hypothetical protein